MGEVVSVGIPGLFGLTGAKTAYKDENVLLGEAQAINFTGNGVVATLNAGVLTVDIEGGGSSINVVDNLNSTSATDALSANQGNVIYNNVQLMYTQFSNDISTINTTINGYGDIVSYSASYFVSNDSLATQLSTKADLVGGLVPANQLPSFVDDILEYADLASFPATGETGKLYVALDSNLVYRWSGTGYAATSPSLALGETINTAYRGDRGKIAYDHSQSTGNPHGTAIADISGLQTALDAKATIANQRYQFVSDANATYIIPASAVTENGRTIIELSNNSLTSITVDAATATGKTVGDSVYVSITGTYAAQALVESGVTLQGDKTFSYQHQTKCLIFKGSNTWKVVG